MIPSYPCLMYSLVSCTSDGFLLNSVLRVFLKCDFSEAYQVFVILVSKMTMKWLLMKLRIPLLIANNLKLSEILFLSVLKLRFICCAWWFQIIVDLNMIPSYPCLISSLVSCTSDGFLLNSVRRVFLKCDFSEAYQVFVILVSKMTMKWLLMKLRIPLLIANTLKLSQTLLSVLMLRFFCCSWWFQTVVDINMIASYPCLISSLVSCTSDVFFVNFRSLGFHQASLADQVFSP